MAHIAIIVNWQQIDHVSLPLNCTTDYSIPVNSPANGIHVGIYFGIHNRRLTTYAKLPIHHSYNIWMYVRRTFPFQQVIRTLGPIQTSKADIKHFRNYTCSNACARTNTRTHTHTHTTVYAIVAGINIAQYTSENKFDMKLNITFNEGYDDHFVSFVGKGKLKTQLISGNKLAYLQHTRDRTITSWCFVMRKILAAMELLHLHNISRPRQSGRLFSVEIFRCIFLDENFSI